jgi:Fe-S cluster assembly ATP-binding protein
MPAKSESMLQIIDLHSSISGKEIIKGISLTIRPGEIHALMGPNGCGKSTLCNALAGHPDYETTGRVLLGGEDILKMKIEERSRKGLFLAFQSPISVPGVRLSSYLRMIYNQARLPKQPLSISQFEELALNEMKNLSMDESFLDRSLNDGFSGGEKKRCEILQMALLSPKYALLDEIDSGLDVDALKMVSAGISKLRKEKNIGILIITHHAQIIEHLTPDFVHIMKAGRIVRSGKEALAHEIVKSGYAKVLGIGDEKDG